MKSLVRASIVGVSLLSASILCSTVGCSSEAPQRDACEVAAPVNETRSALACVGAADVDGRLAMVRLFRRDTQLASELAANVAAIPGDYVVGVMMAGFAAGFGVTLDPFPSHSGTSRFERGTYVFAYDRFAAEGIEAQTADARLRLYWPIDSTSAKKGDLIATSVLDKGAFLVNPRVVLTADGRVSIAHDGPGPLVEILGAGPTPPSPLVTTATKLRAALSTIEVDGDASMTIDNSCNASEFSFAVPRQSVATRAIEMVKGGGRRKSGDDRADVRTWKLGYESLQPRGTVVVDGTAAAAPVTDTLTFGSPGEPASALSCR
ncbi:hypothetical protein BH11MYX4_BH11MYX4_22930 [soil metagenome]